MSYRATAFLAVIACAALWGLSGTIAQLLFHDHVSPAFLVTVRLWGAAVLMLAAIALRSPSRLRLDGTSVRGLAIFGVLGFFAVQYSYFAAIAAIGVATATFLQYLGPALIVIYAAIVGRRLPTRVESLALLLAVSGTALLVLSAGAGSVTLPGLAFGLLSAVSLAFYTIYPRALLRALGPWTTSGYGFLFGAAFATAELLVLHPAGPSHFSPRDLWLIAFVVIVGTLLPFSLYIAALRHLTPSEAGIAATAEPLAAAASSFLLLGQALQGWQYLGGVLIVSAVLVLAGFGGRSAAARVEPSGVTAGGRPDP